MREKLLSGRAEKGVNNVTEDNAGSNRYKAEADSIRGKILMEHRLRKNLKWRDSGRQQLLKIQQ